MKYDHLGVHFDHHQLLEKRGLPRCRISSHGTQERAIVELLIPQPQFLDDEDFGTAALLKYRWKYATFGFASLSDRKPIESQDEIIVMVVPDYQMLERVL